MNRHDADSSIDHHTAASLHREPYAPFLLAMGANKAEASMNLYHVTFTNGYSQGRDRIFATSEQEAVAQSRSNHRKHGGTYRSYSATFKRKAVLDEWL